MTTLVSATKGDLRGCLNTLQVTSCLCHDSRTDTDQLQFIKKRKEDVTEPVVRRATAGIKGGDTNYLSIINNLFSPLSKKRVKELGMTDEEEGRYVARLSREIEGSGRESSIASGALRLGVLPQIDHSVRLLTF